jgi:hypothetical protein
MIKTYTDAYRHIKNGIAKKLNKKVEELDPWVDYDPIIIDNDARRLIREIEGLDTSWAGD